MFTHLHVHSHYSLLDGLAKIDDLIAEAKHYNMNALALTDHGVMYGVIEFYQKAKKAGIKPIIGVEAYLAPNGRHNKRAKIDERPSHLVLLAKNEEGYKNLIKLTTIAHLEGFYYKPRIDKEILKEYSSNLVALTACLQGEIPRLISNNQIEKAEKTILEYQEIFGPENFFLEVQHHPGEPKQAIVNKKIFELGKKLNIPIVATNDLHYIKAEDAEIQDILLCLQTKKKKTDSDRLCMLSDDYSFRSPEKMKEDFKDHPEVISNTQKVVDLCNVEIELGKTKLPYFPLPEEKTADEYLEELCYQNLSKHYPNKNPEVMDRLKYELSVIQKTGFASYFLIVQDFVNWAKKNNIVVGPGRGSAAGSIVSYLLNVTSVNPLKYGLVFERFLNPERISMPDIDLDFADIRRDEVIRYVENKYGRDHVAQIITFGTMASRAAVRDVGRVLDYPYTFCDKLAKMIPMQMTLKQVLENVQELRVSYESNQDIKKIIDAARKLEGVARHASKHACGVVITPEPLNQYLPIQYDTSGKEKIIITQYEMHAIEDLGLLKMDFLGLKNLTLLETAVDIIQAVHKKEIDINNLPLDDKKTFRLFKNAETIGVFQLESDGMRRYLKQLKPTNLEDIIAMVALYRPGPMELIPDYIAGKHGTKQPVYLHPKLKPILEKTYGIAVYQEQLLEIVKELAGFSLAEADVLRKAVGKKIQKLLEEQKEKFIKGCVQNKVDKQIAERVWHFIEPFAGYGFNKSHATCYATIAHQTAYLKANFPSEFMASLLTADQGDTDRIAIEVEECKRMGIEVLPPDINESFKSFAVVPSKDQKKKSKIRFGLLVIKNVGENIVKTIIKERKENGAFQNLEDFLTRVQSKDLNKKSLESFIKSGALDKFGERGELLGNVEILLEFSKKIQKDNENGQSTLFSGLPAGQKLGLKLRKAPPVERQQRLIWEKELLGLFISEHPITELKDKLNKINKPIGELNKKTGSTVAIIAGIITNIKRIITSNKESMIFAKIEDETGPIEAIVFPRTLRNYPNLWQENKIVLILGRKSDKDGIPKLIVEKAEELVADKIEEIVKKFKSNNLLPRYY